jgi:hypothetical protein
VAEIAVEPGYASKWVFQIGLGADSLITDVQVVLAARKLAAISF